MIELESARMWLREITENDLVKVLPVSLSNPDYLRYTEGSEGDAGRYNLERWQRDWSVAQLMPGRHLLGCYLKTNGEAIGLIDYLEEHDVDGKPWLGLLIIHKAYQRQGFGAEAFQCLTSYFRSEKGWPLLRIGVLKQNEAAFAFWHQIGFQPLYEASSRLSAGTQQIVVLELPL